MVAVDTLASHRLKPFSLYGLFAALLILLGVSSCGGDPSRNYTISVEYRSFGLDEQDSQDSNNYSQAIVSVSRVDVSQSNAEVTSELFASPFRNGKVAFRGQVESPMWVEIVVDSDDAAKPLTVKSLVEPGERVALVVIDYSDQVWRGDTIGHIGTLSNVEDSKKKFTVTGNLSSLNIDLSKAVARFLVQAWDEYGEPDWSKLGNVLLQDGTFSLELEIEEPVLVEVSIDAMLEYSWWTLMIAEPAENIRVQPKSHTAHASTSLTTGWFHSSQDSEQTQTAELEAVSGAGRHAKLLESWQRSFTYRHILQEMDETFEEHLKMRDELELRRVRGQQTGEMDGANGALNFPGSKWVDIEPSEGCEHVDLSQVLPRSWAIRRIGSRYEELGDELNRIRLDVLNEIARNDVDPMDVLLALELGALDSTDTYSEKMQIYEKLAEIVSQELVEGRINPARYRFAAIIESMEVEDRMVPGQKAPNFELPNLEGTSVNFYEILNESDLVFLIFNRSESRGNSWIADQLGGLLESFKRTELQVVELLVGSDTEHWDDLNDNEYSGWIRLHDSNQRYGSSLARSYASAHLWKSYLIDSTGCIVQTSPRWDHLKEFLSSYF